MSRLCIGWALLASLLMMPARGLAHLDLVAPVSRYGPDVLKSGPCGVPGGERSDNVTVFEPGETIEVRWVEYVQHPGHYRIAFDEDGDDDFVDPATIDELDSNDAVLLDGIEDTRESNYAVEVTLPNVECDNCTLQVIQVMYDKLPYELPGDDIYYQCADLVLREGGGPAPDPEPDPSTSGDGSGVGSQENTGGGGCATAPLAPNEPWWLLLVVVWAARRLARAQDLPL